jgi:phospholipase/carboxylesterase
MIHQHVTGNPTVVALHGTGGNEREFLSFSESLVTGVGHLSVRGEEPENGQNRWFRRFAEGVFDEDNLRFRADQLAEFVQKTLPTEKRIVLGFSNGANMASALVIRHPELFSAAVLLAPMVPFAEEPMPELTGMPILMVCGEHDPMVPRVNAQTLATQYATAGADVQVHWHAGGHSPDQTSLFVAKSFLAGLKLKLSAE